MESATPPVQDRKPLRRAFRFLRERPRGTGLAVYVAISLLFVTPVIIHPGGMFPGYGGDAEQYMWYLGWFWHAVSTGQNPLVTHLFNYPHGLNLMWNTSILSESVLLGPLAYLFGTTAIYNIWFVVNLVLAGLLGRALFRELGVSAWLAVLGGVLVELMPYVTTQALSHISLITTGPVLAGALILTRAFRGRLKRPWLAGAAFGLLVALQFYTLIEVLVSASLVLALTLVVAFVTDRGLWHRFWKALPRQFIVSAILVAALLLVPGVAFMLVGPYRVFQAVQPANVYVSDLLNFVWPTRAFLLHLPGPDPANFFTGNFAEDNGYIGLFGLYLIIWSARRLWHRRVVRLATYAGGFVTLLSMGQTLHVAGATTTLYLPWVIIDHLPLVHDLLPGRLMLYADLAAIMLAILGVEEWLRTPHGKSLRERLPQWAAVLMVASWLPTIPYPATVMPVAGTALQPGTAVHRALAGQPTYVLTAAFPEVMAALGQSGYAIPVANVYGHNTNRLGHLRRLATMTIMMSPLLPASAYIHAITSGLIPLGVTRLVFLPRPSLGQPLLSPGALSALYDALGPPIVASKSGVLVWRVPDHLDAARLRLLRQAGYVPQP